MLKIDRFETIMRLLHENGSLLVSDACEILGCSDQTIRRDFQELEEQGKLKRIHGGAFIPSVDDAGVPAKVRAKLIVTEKTHMADSSTTCNTLARHLMGSKLPLTMITNSSPVARDFLDADTSAQLICTGGRYMDNLGGFFGTDSINCISSHIADKAFISCNAISREYGILDNYEHQMDLRRAMIANSRERYLLVDHTKFDDRASFITGDFSSINGIITDQEPAEVWLSHFRKLGISVIW